VESRSNVAKIRAVRMGTQRNFPNKNWAPDVLGALFAGEGARAT